ncbi:hypothetical protein SIO70_15720 [Chitinophaga sancti]|uniref:energy transducer TonB n=1 Tax=Chitinophaga sancti TaxID=1004 RepID=UPI002A7554A3|nr:hypothetical protein [Chitinophaga sancti]WPQ66309.1 hypothetical protein SIO70_15720 [Chitinophaga sancti]
MKLNEITTCIKSSFILMCLFAFSCNAQNKSDASVCQEMKDIYENVYMINCLKEGKLKAVFYIDSLGNKIEVCKAPEKQALLFEEKKEFLYFLDENLIWKTNKDIMGKIFIAMYIDETGNIIEKRVIKAIDVCPECTTSAIDLVNKIKPRRAALMNGKPVKSIQVIVIPFNSI